ncbi:hypothetical protein GH714_016639 [Hevea brasiliensis]|uniref:Uncharacterized protein n=1 Tax=Hevea brasiliensis TaxID=3981 RepID=A0A6A6KRQ6_HEVBR|nr:hypothetical protein GH714_016639 [Hevea brasiliensis]
MHVSSDIHILSSDLLGLGYSRNRVREMEILIAVASAIAVEIPKALVAPVSRHIGYLTGYELNIKNLKEELEKLIYKKTVVDRHVAGPTAGSIIHWQEEVEAFLIKIQAFLSKKIKKVTTTFSRCTLFTQEQVMRHIKAAL